MAWPRAPLHIGGWSPSKGRTLCQQLLQTGKEKPEHGMERYGIYPL